jgi:HPt (histidine-containing phosphotransfer) domain-containing protein
MDNLIKSLVQTLGWDGTQSGRSVPSPESTVGTGSDRAVATHGSLIHSTLPTDDPEFCEIIAEFATRLQEKLCAMHAAAEQAQYAELAQLAHWLKGSGGTAGFDDFTDLARQLQAAAHGQDDSQVAALLTAIQDIADRIAVPQATSPPSL